MSKIPEATEYDLKLDLAKAYIAAEFVDPPEALRQVIRLAHHHQQEAERRVDPLDPDFKIALAYEERISTLEATLRDARVTIQRTEAEERARESAAEWFDREVWAEGDGEDEPNQEDRDVTTYPYRQGFLAGYREGQAAIKEKS